MTTNYYEFINIAISFSILLMVVLLLILSAKKFRRRPAIYWAMIIALLLGYYFLTLFYRYDWRIIYDHIVDVLVAFSPFLFLLYAHFFKLDIKTGKDLWRYFFVLILFTLGLIPYLFYLNDSSSIFLIQYSNVYIVCANVTGSIGFLVVSIWPIVKLKTIKKCDKQGIPTSIKYNGIQYKVVRIMSHLILLHGLIWFTEINLTIMGSEIGYYFNQVNLIYFLFVGYIFVILFLIFPAAIYELSLEKEILEKEKYQFSTLPKEKAIEYLDIMNQHMLNEKPYLNPDLTLVGLSDQLDMPHTILSQIMNNIVKQNFYEYVNNFRVEEFKRLANDQHNRHLKILSLAYDSGFKSKTTFNTTFKKFTGITPSEYMKQNG